MCCPFRRCSATTPTRAASSGRVLGEGVGAMRPELFASSVRGVPVAFGSHTGTPSPVRPSSLQPFAVEDEVLRGRSSPVSSHIFSHLVNGAGRPSIFLEVDANVRVIRLQQQIELIGATLTSASSSATSAASSATDPGLLKTFEDHWTSVRPVLGSTCPSFVSTRSAWAGRIYGRSRSVKLRCSSNTCVGSIDYISEHKQLGACCGMGGLWVFGIAAILGRVWAAGRRTRSSALPRSTLPWHTGAWRAFRPSQTLPTRTPT